MKRIEREAFKTCLEMFEEAKKQGILYKFEEWLKDRTIEGKKWG